MNTEEKNGLKLLRFDSFKELPGLECAVSTRQSGVSTGPYAGLNLGSGTGDKIENVEENLGLFCAALGAEPARLERMRQRHTANVAVMTAGGGVPPENTDALLTAVPGIPLLALSADCALTAFYDPARKVLAVIHSGWRGAFLDIYGATLAVMKMQFGSEPGDILAGVSPMISAANYPVREDFMEKLKAFYPGGADKRFLTLKEGRHFFNLRELLRLRLEALGVRKHEFMHLCTYSEKEMFYSWRRDGEKTGRFGLMAMLKE
ncbi:MAG: polyphenol oxidase family protein [Elusimicrobiales bacterium]|nr:polyphenol oxidase family protein [Elusimicrobiales bacterium]